ncbi:MAG: DUF1573 domain-containing protein [Bacteroidaceae bacterium]|nr:DUF1573 domain-containing protein [Bacteroidaceae bacterium]
MKKLLFAITMALCTSTAMAQKQAEIVFEADTINLGQFSEANGVQTCEYTFTNKGTAPLIIHQAIATCGCTVPEFKNTPVKPGEQGKITVTYNGKGKLLGPFTKTISVRSNAKNGIKRLYLKGDMTK